VFLLNDAWKKLGHGIGHLFFASVAGNAFYF
jgi:hypothetical protein